MKKIKLLIILIIVLCATGCGSHNQKGNNSIIKKETDSTKQIEETIKKSDEGTEYKFITSDNIISVKLKYDNKKFALEDGALNSEFYKFSIDAVEFKNPMFDEFDSEEKIGDYAYTTSSTDVQIFTTIKINENTAISVVCETNGFYTVDEILADDEYKKILNDIQINVEKK